MSKVKHYNLPYYITDSIKADLNEHYGKYASNKNYLDEWAFDKLNSPDLEENETLPLYPFEEGCFVEDEAVQSIVLVYWYWALQEKIYMDKNKDKQYKIDEDDLNRYLLTPLEDLKKGAKSLLQALKDDRFDRDKREMEDYLEHVIDDLSGKHYVYTEIPDFDKAFKRLPGARKQDFVREEEYIDYEYKYRFIDTSFGDDVYDLKRELERRGYELSDITVTGDDSGDDISMGVDTVLGIAEFLEERGYVTQLKHWESIVEDSKVLSEIKRRAPFIVYL